NIEKEKFITITNGFDPDDFKGITLERLSEKFTMSYIGSFYRGRTPEYFLKALTELIEENQGIEKEISVIFLGEILEEEYKTLVNGFKWDKILKIINWLPHNEAIRYMSSSDVLLLFIQKQGNMTDYIVTGKIFEYLAAKKPILALVPSTGVAAEIIRKTNTGAVIEPDNPQEIKKAIIELYNKYKEKCLKFEGISAEIAKFSYERLGLNLTEILNSILSSKGNKNGE
ncbi:MAG: glycosyltransferase, partial [bacterium]